MVQPIALSDGSYGQPLERHIDSTALHPPALVREPERTLRVLAIDDDPDILEALAEALPGSLFKVETTSALDAFRNQMELFRPDIVITDLAMPSHDGTDVLQALRGRAYAGEIVIMSGQDWHVVETARRVAISHGLKVRGVLHKPFTPDQLLGLLTRHNGADDEAQMRVALSERRIRPYFQPKIDLKTGSIIGAEALSRWYHPDRGLLLPQTYLQSKNPSAKNSLHDFTIMERSTEFCAKLNAVSPGLKIAVNFAVDVVLCNEFIEVVTDAYRRHGITPEQLIIELTEHDASESYEELAERLLKLRLLGIGISIDDFGTGHSSLSRLQRLPVNEIKIDRSFISGLGDYSDNITIVRSIVDLAHKMQCTVVAEGVETIQAMETLRGIDCDMAQGFLFSPAVNESTFLALARENPFLYRTA